jgi:putative aldouronate transport system substrate-binding protein
MKKLIALTLALAMCLSLVSFSAFADDTVKITILVDGTIPDQNNGRDAFEARWEELHPGFDLEIWQPDHSAYYTDMQQRMVSGNYPDVLILSSTYYADFARNGVLWDMTEAWENSKTKNSGRFTGDNVFEGLKIDGKLYGFAPTRGNGCVTYVKKAWLDAVGMEAPKTFDDYIKMCEAFVNNDPDGNGQADTYAISAAGFIGNEAPFINYLPEFYQDAYPYFVQQEDGTWIDGFLTDAMKAALERLRDAYAKGLIDPDTLTNSTAQARTKFYDDKFGVFTYWAGTWATNLKTNLEANGRSGELIALPPLEGVPAYFDRVPPVWAITNKCANPQLVFDTFIDTMLDGGDCQMLFTYGPENVYYSFEGGFHMLENLEKAGTNYTKFHIDPMLALASFAEGYYDPKEESVLPEAKAASALFNENSRLASIVPATEVMGEYNGQLTTLKNEMVANVIMGVKTYDQALADFQAAGGDIFSAAIVESLNALN